MHYEQEGIALVGLAGKLYGSGSSRDWAGKGPALLGIKAVMAQSFERIHRSNLVQMGVLPLEFKDGQSAESIGLTGTETFDISIQDKGTAHVIAHADTGDKEFDCTVRVDTPMEHAFMRAGGILPYVLDSLVG
jgi:aconitate hydratase